MDHVHGYGSIIWLFHSQFNINCILNCIVVMGIVLPITNIYTKSSETMYGNWTIDLSNMSNE